MRPLPHKTKVEDSVAFMAPSPGAVHPCIGIVGKGALTYLYINGLRVDKTIQLTKNVALVPVRSRRNFRKAVLEIPNEVARSYFVLMEHNINAQFRITSISAADECKNAFNAQWDALLLSAILNCFAIANIQGDVSIERVARFEQIRLTNSHLFGINRPSYKVCEKDCQWISQYYKLASRMMVETRFLNAVHAMASYRWHTLPNVQLAIIWSGIESLFDIKSELSFRLSVYIAKFLHDGDKESAKTKYKEIKKLYGARSAAVHGSAIKEEVSDAVQQSAVVLQSLIRKCVEHNGLPNENDLIFG